MRLNMVKDMVSIIIPTYNRREDLDRCLSTVFKQRFRKKEVIIVDDGSSDDTVSYIKKKYHSIHLIANKENKGPNYCRNIGALKSNGEYLLFLDSDVELTNRNQIINMVRIAEENNRLGELGGHYELPNKLIKALSLKGEIFFDSKNPLQECDFVGSGCLFVRKKLLYENNGFDEFVKGHETEFEFGINLKRKGYINLFGPSVALKHNKSPIERNNIGIKSEDIKFSTRLLWKRKNRLRYIVKNFGVGRALKEFMVGLLREDIVTVLAFVKQQFLGLKIKDSEDFSNLREKLHHFWFLLRSIYEPFLWNLIHLNETLRSRGINFIEYNK